MDFSKSTVTGVLFCVFTIGMISCNGGAKHKDREILTEQSDINQGKVLFMQDCSACHNFHQDGIGPQLGGLTREVPVDYIRDMIINAQSVIESGNERATGLFEEYQTYMPSFAMYSEESVEQVIAYMHTKPAPESIVPEEDTLLELQNPIASEIRISDLTVNLEFVTQIPESSEEKPRTRIAKLDYIPGTDRLFISDLRGKLYELKHGYKPKVYLDFNEERSDFIPKPGLATGLGSFAFHPDFLQNGLFYTTHTEPPQSADADFSLDDSLDVTLQWVLTEWKVADPSKGKPDHEGREMLRIDMMTGVHGVQEITFDPNAREDDPEYGLLHICVGDGGSVGKGALQVAMGPAQVWGSIIRIDPLGSNSSNGQYGIPETNPFVQNDSLGGTPEIYAYGFRNPHRLTWDQDNRMLVSDIGQHRVEELNLVEPGRDYGWPRVEGTFLIRPLIDMSEVYKLPDEQWVREVTFPVAQYDHDQGNAISGGFEYTGSKVPELKGKYLFGDIVRGRLFYVELTDLKLGQQAPVYEWNVAMAGQLTDLVLLSGSTRVDLRLGRDSRGEMYLFTKADGKVYRMVAEPEM